MDQHSVQVYSSAKPRIVTCKLTVLIHNLDICSIQFPESKRNFVLFSARELQSKEYFIWNSTGTAPVSSGQMML